MRVLSVVGARPNFMKVAPLHRAFLATGLVESRIVHTGQHYDARMSEVFFDQLGLPRPDVYLGVGGGTHAQQTAAVIAAFEGAVLEQDPDVVLVVGDVNSTAACALVASKLHIPLVHVEAGLRSGDRTMPEEINRIVTDAISDRLYVTEPSGLENLLREGVPRERVQYVGNVMIDTLAHYRGAAEAEPILDDLGLREAPYVLMTMHRPATVDDPAGLEALVGIVEALSAQATVVFPMHPRTQANLETNGLLGRLRALGSLRLLDPVGYLSFLALQAGAACVVTDSGGVQEETTYLGVPCVTLRPSTERPVTVEVGTNVLASLQQEIVLEHVERALRGEWKEGRTPDMWDGNAAERIAADLVAWASENFSSVSAAAVA